MELWEAALFASAADGVESRDEGGVGGVGAVVDNLAETFLSEASICGTALELISELVISGALEVMNDARGEGEGGVARNVSPSSTWRLVDIDATLEKVGRDFERFMSGIEGGGDVNGSKTLDDAEIGGGARVMGASGVDGSLLCTELRDTERGVLGAGRLGSATARFNLLQTF